MSSGSSDSWPWYRPRRQLAGLKCQEKTGINLNVHFIYYGRLVNPSQPRTGPCCPGPPAVRAAELPRPACCGAAPGWRPAHRETGETGPVSPRGSEAVVDGGADWARAHGSGLVKRNGAAPSAGRSRRIRCPGSHRRSRLNRCGGLDSCGPNNKMNVQIAAGSAGLSDGREAVRRPPARSTVPPRRTRRANGPRSKER